MWRTVRACRDEIRTRGAQKQGAEDQSSRAQKNMEPAIRDWRKEGHFKMQIRSFYELPIYHQNYQENSQRNGSEVKA